MRAPYRSDEVKVAAVILAAGSSSRLGEPKQNVYLGSETLLERTIRIAGAADLGPIFIVVSPELVVALHLNARVLMNEDAAEGMASSIRIGVAAAIEASVGAIVILACDQPFVTAEHLRQLAASGDHVAASAYAGRKGVPAYFPARVFQDLLELRGDTGARDLLVEEHAITLKKGELDIDTAEDLKRARELKASEPQ